MKPNWILSLIVGLALGVTVGLVVSRSVRSPAPKGTSLLLEFSLAALAAEAGATNWQVFEDRTYRPFPALARSPHVARRIVGRAEVPDPDLDKFIAKFHRAATTALETPNARLTGQFDLIQDSTQVVEGKPVRRRLELPRYFYSIGDLHGAADIGYVLEAGRVTFIASLIEGQ